MADIGSTEKLKLDLIFNMGMHDFLPIYSITNKEESRMFPGHTNKRPSFLKLIGPSVPDISQLIAIYRGLVESFP